MQALHAFKKVNKSKIIISQPPRSSSESQLARANPGGSGLRTGTHPGWEDAPSIVGHTHIHSPTD